jgi:hypothetical protein
MKKVFFTLSIALFVYTLPAQDYFPIEVGNFWIYNMIDDSGNYIADDTLVIKDNYTLNGKNIFTLVENDYSPDELYSGGKDNNDIFLNDGGNWEKIFQHKYTEGDQWYSIGDTLRVEFYGSVTVPAGHFPSCFYLKIDNTSGYILAPNVGIVKAIGDGFDYMVLKKFYVSTFTGISDELNNKIEVFPNPSSNYISIPVIDNSVQLEICDLSGKPILQKDMSSNKTDQIIISDLPSGVYIGKILLKNNQNMTFKFIKQ